MDEKHVLIIGGSGGQSFFYSDVWILNMEGDLWKWKQVDVRNHQEGPSSMWSNPACKVRYKITFFWSSTIGFLILHKNINQQLIFTLGIL